MIVIIVHDLGVMCKCVQVIFYYIIFMKVYPLKRDEVSFCE